MKKIILYILLIQVIIGISSCEKFLDVNEPINNPKTVTPAVALPVALAGAGFANNNVLNKFGSVLVNHVAGAANNSATFDIYNVTAVQMDNQWNFELYAGSLISCEDLIKIADEKASPAYSGIAKIIKAYAFSLATDMWGDVPYSQALKGDALLQPRIDKQEDIYKGNAGLGIQSLFDLVKEGIAELKKASALKPGADDIIYKGNLDKWEMMANTLLLKFAMTISRVEPTLATTIINEVLTGNKYIKSNADDCNVTYGTSTGNFAAVHDYTNVTNFQNDQLLSTRFKDSLDALNDPRLAKFFTKPAANYVTLDNGSNTNPGASSTWSKYNTYVTGGGAGPVRLVTNFQRAFILAEAAIRLGTPGDPQLLFAEGIRASMKLTGLTDQEIDTYFLANPTVVTLTGSDANKIHQIMTQKWIAWVGNGVEAYNDWRRTGFPLLAPHQNAAGVDGTRPVRIPYSTLSDEQARNPNIPNPGPQSNVRVWWDVD